MVPWQILLKDMVNKRLLSHFYDIVFVQFKNLKSDLFVILIFDFFLELTPLLVLNEKVTNI